MVAFCFHCAIYIWQGVIVGCKLFKVTSFFRAVACFYCCVEHVDFVLLYCICCCVFEGHPFGFVQSHEVDKAFGVFRVWHAPCARWVLISTASVSELLAWRICCMYCVVFCGGAEHCDWSWLQMLAIDRVSCSIAVGGAHAYLQTGVSWRTVSSKYL